MIDLRAKVWDLCTYMDFKSFKICAHDKKIVNELWDSKFCCFCFNFKWAETVPRFGSFLSIACFRTLTTMIPHSHSLYSLLSGNCAHFETAFWNPLTQHSRLLDLPSCSFTASFVDIANFEKIISNMHQIFLSTFNQIHKPFFTFSVKIGWH